MNARRIGTRLSAFIAVLALILVPLSARADVQTISSGSQSSTSASGSLVFLPLNGQSTCSVVVSDTGTASLTIQGTADGTATLATNANFGSNGVISVTSTPQTVAGNVAAFPKGFTGTWSSNNGTLTYTETCSAATGVSGGGTVTTTASSPGGATANPAYSRIQDASSTRVAAIDPTGNVQVSFGGSNTISIPTGVGNTVVKNLPGRLVALTITVAGTVSLTCYDNATTNSGTIIGITPATTTVGQQYIFNNPAANGITCAGAAGSPVATASYY